MMFLVKRMDGCQLHTYTHEFNHKIIIQMAAILAALSLVFRQSLSVGPDSTGRQHLDRNSGRVKTRDWRRTHP